MHCDEVVRDIYFGSITTLYQVKVFVRNVCFATLIEKKIILVIIVIIVVAAVYVDIMCLRGAVLAGWTFQLRATVILFQQVGRSS